MVAVAGLAPVPKFHAYVAPGAAVPVYVIVLAFPTHTELGLTVKLDVGALLTSIVCVVVEEQAPVVRVSVTVLVPVVDQETL